MTNQETKTSTTSTFHKAITLAKSLDELDYIEGKLHVTKRINRRTKAGRAETEVIRGFITTKAYELIDNGEQPFK